MELSRWLRLPPLIVLIILLDCCQNVQSRFFGIRPKRQNGARMYLSSSYVLPGGEGDDPSEWTEWSSPSECSRSCGGGVSYQTRECRRFLSNGATACTGGDRKYFSCNTQDCPEEEADFRSQQCSRFDHVPFDGIYYEWVPYLGSPNPCQLSCMPKGERFYYVHKPQVIDGTRCNDQSLDVCVDGQCQPVGCDMMLGSNAKEDKCRKCGGDGSTCKTVGDKFTINNLSAGYNDILLIPNGATNIRVEEVAPSNNYIAVRNLSSHYYLNGNWRIDFPRPMLFAGSWWNYQRKPTGFAAPDHLTCPGPITESIYIVMLVQDKNVSIDYEYSIPTTTNTRSPDVYTWTHMEYGPCSATCGGGIQTRIVTCNNRLNLEEVDSSLCDKDAKPAESQECATEPCAPQWVPTEWGKCSKGCGADGVQTRTVTCERASSNGDRLLLDDSICLEQIGNKPATKQECNRNIENCPKYHLGPWTPCDKLCGEGKQKRRVTCYMEENGRKRVLSDEDCVEEKPETEKSCMLHPCEGVDWIISEWSGCNSCGQVTETRTAICASKTGQVYPDEFCAPEVPLLSRPCKSDNCKVLWFTSEWSKCSAACGKGLQSRFVLCGEYNGKSITKIVDDSQCDASTKPTSQQECEGEEKECPGQWFTGPWGPCSRPCGGGERQREVLCLANGEKSTNCDETKIESLSEKCNTQACTPDEVIPVDSTSKPILSDEEDVVEVDCDEDEVEVVTVKMKEDLKIAEGIDLDGKATPVSSFITDELMLSDAPSDEPSSDDLATAMPFTTIEGSGDETETSTDITGSTVEGSGEGTELLETSEIPFSTEISKSTYDVSTEETTETATLSSTDNTETTESETSSTFTETSESLATSEVTLGYTTETAETSSVDDSSVVTDFSTATPETSTSSILESSPSSVSTESTESLSDSTTDSSTSTDSTSEYSSESSESSTSTDLTTQSSSESSESSTFTESTFDFSGSTELTLMSSETTTESSTELSMSTEGITTSFTESSTEVSTQEYSTQETTDVSETSEVSGSTSESSTSESTSESSSSSTETTVEETSETAISTESTSDSVTNTFESTEVTTEYSTESTSQLSSEASVFTEFTTDSSTGTSLESSTSITSDVTTDLIETSSTDASTETSTEAFTDASTETSTGASTESFTEVSTETSSEASTEVSTGASTETSTEVSSESSTEASTGASTETSTEVSTEASTEVPSESSTEASTDVSLDSSSPTDQSTIGVTDTVVTDETTGSDITSEFVSEETSTAESAITSESTTSYETPVSSEASSEISETTEYSVSTETTQTAETTLSEQTTEVSENTASSETVSSDETTSSEETTESTVSTVSSESTSESSEASTSVTETITSDEATTESGTTIMPEATTKLDVSSASSVSMEYSETTIDIWSTEEDLDQSTPYTLEAVVTKQQKPKKCKVKTCTKSPYGCCPDGKTTAKGPFDEGCPIPKTCAETEFGCCSDGVSPAAGSNFEGCPKSQCAETLFGCCPDNFTPAEGDENEGCPEPTTLPPTTIPPTTVTTEESFTESPISTISTISTVSTVSTVSETSEMYESSTETEGTTQESPAEDVEPSCSFNEFGCCPDGKTSATGENFAGCDKIDCSVSVYGCCHDRRSFATGPNYAGCAQCTFEPFGCCPDNETPAHGPLGEGCCLASPYGCCPDNINSARGPNFEDCSCQYSPYGCCPDEKTPARGPAKEGCGCESTQFGCCPDKLTPSNGPKFEGCPCHTLQFGCCPDGLTVAQGPHHYGCHCSQTEFKCCPDDKTPAKGPNNEGCTCMESRYGCCPDGITSAQGDKFEGCENVKEPPQKACGLPKESGPCQNYTIKYFFDTSYGACARFWYGGCEGNGNRFESDDDCKQTCQEYVGKEACFLPKSSGPCTGFNKKWYFNVDYNRCEEFNYGGCYGTNNRFDTKEDCLALCAPRDSMPACEQPMDEGPCEGNFERWYYDNQTDVCHPFRYGGCKGNKNNYPTEAACSYNCRQPGVHQDYCSLPKQVGDCNGKLARWYYSENDKRCAPFYYSGCGGNSNNFPTLDSCERHCPKEVAKDTCEIAAEVGDCTNYQALWYYDTKDERCRQFYYGGCGGNENRFPTEEACMQRCEKKSEMPPSPPTIAPKDVCEQDAAVGDCGNYTLLWYYDHQDKFCRQFYYGGCGGNDNRFSTEDECKNRCIGPVPGEPEQKPPAPESEQSAETSKCFLPANSGNCLGYQIRWHYNSVDGVCDSFVYTECEGNANNFASEHECELECFPAQPTCELPPLRGNCSERINRWHFDKTSGKCQQFEFSGCRPNRNNFKTEQECMEFCGDQAPPATPVYSVCDLPIEAGECENHTTAWYYDSETLTCVAFSYSGCGGNGNRFQTREQCERQCGEYKGADVCNEEVMTGPCRQWQTRYYYNKVSRTCEPFTYGGCQGSGNRFEDLAECESVCIIGQEPTSTAHRDICKQNVDIGRCLADSVNERRWYYDDSRGTCVAFIYSGCAGNQNNFRTFESCYDFCAKEMVQPRPAPAVPEAQPEPEITNEVLPVSACEEYDRECQALRCPYGTRRVPVERGCQRCECVNPCSDYSCPEGQKCAIEISVAQSGQFVPVCRSITKPGDCPTLSNSTGGDCTRECYDDADCRGDNKCCSNGCNYICVRPIAPTVRPTVPTTAAPPIIYPGDVRVSLQPKKKDELDVKTPVGGIAVLRCFAMGNPAPNVTWFMNNVLIDTNHGRYVLTSAGDLTIVQVRQTDSGSYVCVASNGLGEPVRREIDLQVTEPVDTPAYVYGDKNATQIVVLNRPAVVRCPAGGYPQPMVYWWRNRERLPLVHERYEFMRDYSLRFYSIQLTDLGPYTCHVWNRVSTRPASIKITLKAVGPVRAVNNDEARYLQYILDPAKAPVTQAPTYPYRPTRPPAIPPPIYDIPLRARQPVRANAVLGMDPNNVYTPGATIRMGCSVQGYPKPNVTWIKNGLPLLSSERIQISNVEPYSLTITNADANDSGRYGCKAANSISYSLSEETITIESAIPLSTDCIDNAHFANCKLIVAGRYCKNKYYAKFCCRSCALAGQL